MANRISLDPTTHWLKENELRQCLPFEKNIPFPSENQKVSLDTVSLGTYEKNPSEQSITPLGKTLVGLVCVATGLIVCASSSCAPADIDDNEPLPLPNPDDDDTPPDNPVSENCDGYLVSETLEDFGDYQKGLCVDFAEVSSEIGLNNQTSHNGVSVFDYDDDGDEDVYLLNSNTPNQFYQNNNGQFSEINVGLEISNNAQAADWFDFDDDGDFDILVAGQSGSFILENSGGAFSNSPSFQSTSVANDGAFIDGGILLCTENGTEVHRQNGNSFSPISPWDVGLQDPGDGQAIALGDYNGDGLVDIAIANMAGPDRLFENLGGGQYQFVEDQIGLSTEFYLNRISLDIDFVDFDSDGDLDLYTSVWGEPNSLHENQGENFVEIAASVGLQDQGQTVSAAWGDFANLGLPGVALGRFDQENLLYLPLPDVYENITSQQMAQSGDTLQVEWFDYNNDGWLDLAVVMASSGLQVFENRSRTVRIYEN